MLDSFSMFTEISPGAHSTITGLVTLLTVAHMLSIKRNEINEKRKDNQNLLFIIFDGEAFDYIGSSSVVFDMERDQFPFSYQDDREQPALINLKHISHFIELSQLAPDDSTFWIHSDPVSMENEKTANTVTEMFNILENNAKNKTITVKRLNNTLPLPPASFQIFLRKRIDIPGFVIADHFEEFTNRYYNSILDTTDTPNFNTLPSKLTDLSSVIANTLYQLLTGKEPDSPLQANESLVSSLLGCYLQTHQCDFIFYFRPDLKMPVGPFQTYVSVGVVRTNLRAIIYFTSNLFKYLTGKKLSNRTRENCSPVKKQRIYRYDWIIGPEDNSTGTCVESTVYVVDAESPASKLQDWKSTEYSTWTESSWHFSLRIFLIPTYSQEMWTLCSGIIIIFISFFFVYFLDKRASVIFNPELCNQPDDFCYVNTLNELVLKRINQFYNK